MAGTAHDVALAHRLFGLLDLTTLNDSDDGEVVRALAAYAATPVGRVAALCTWSRLIGDALAALAGTGVPVAAVANFPAGQADVAEAAAQSAQAVAAGALKLTWSFPGGHSWPAMPLRRWRWCRPAMRPAVPGRV